MQYWYIIINNSQVGPLTIEEVRSSFITPETMVWHEGMTQWLPAGQVPELAYLFTSGNAGNTGTTPPPPPHNANSQGFGQQQCYYGQPGNNYYVSPSGKDKTVAGILAILLGGFGVHYFYLGHIGAGFICILLSFVTCGLWNILMLAQGIMMLIMSPQEFDEKYVYTDATLPLF